MVEILSKDIEELLCQAEQRLQGHSTMLPVMNKLHSHSTTTKVTRGGITKEKVSVRQPKKTNTPEKKLALYGLPQATEEIKKEWQAIRLRSILDPKHQKKKLRATPPQFAALGTIIEGPTEFYSARLSRKEQKRSMLEEVMRDANASKLRAKFIDIQEKKASGKKGFYKNLMTQRRKKR